VLATCDVVFATIILARDQTEPDQKHVYPFMFTPTAPTQQRGLKSVLNRMVEIHLNIIYCSIFLENIIYEIVVNHYNKFTIL
jgi:hypothetical protein